MSSAFVDKRTVEALRLALKHGDHPRLHDLLTLDVVEKLLAERDDLRHRLRFVWWHAFLATQTALDRGGTLSELRRTIIQEIKDAARGIFPTWWKNEPDTHQVAGLEP